MEMSIIRWVLFGSMWVAILAPSDPAFVPTWVVSVHDTREECRLAETEWVSRIQEYKKRNAKVPFDSTVYHECRPIKYREVPEIVRDLDPLVCMFCNPFAEERPMVPLR